MKKFSLLLLAILLIALSVAVITVNAADDQSICPYCGRDSEDWIALTTNGQDISDGHYYLARDGHVSAAHTIASGKTVCLDLRGYCNNANRVFTVKNGGTLYIWGGSIEARGYGTRELGGLVNLAQGGTLVMNDVDVYYKAYDGRDTEKGGILAVAGNATLTDCTITGGRATVQGGNVYVSSTGELTLNNTSVTGGMIEEDTTHIARCVYSEGKVVLSGDSDVELMKMGTDAVLDISGAYTGAVDLYFDSVPTAGTVIGDVTNGGDITGAEISVVNGEREVRVNGESLTINNPPVAVVNGVRYDDLKEAIEAAGEHTLELRRSIDTVTFSKDLTVDLAGCDIKELQADEGITVSVMDTETDDYDISDGVYGTITTYTGNVEGKKLNSAEQYLVCKDGDITSFHKLRMVINQVSMRPSAVGLYYSSDFKGDSMIQSQLQTFGVELSLKKSDLEDQTFEDGRYTAIGKAKFNGDTATTSTLLTNVMRTSLNTLTNRRNAATKVYGRPYIRFSDGSMLQGEIAEKSLQAFVEEISDTKTLEGLSWQQQEALLKMYNTFESAMKHWSVEDLKTLNDGWEDSIQKILVIGNSHSQDSVWQLQNVFAHQKPGQKVVVGVLYKSGCTVEEHVAFATGNLANYQYYKNIYGEWSGDDTPKDTMLQALEDEQWDYILLQEMNNPLGQESSFDNENLQTLIDYVKANTKGDPILGFNMVWANPVTETYWNEETRPTELPDRWVERYEEYFELDQMQMYECMTANTQTYIAANENINRDYIMPSGTAVQYANNVLGCTDLDLYRDYTHLSEMARLMVSYLWYSKLTGKTISSVEDIEVDVIPDALRRFPGRGDIAVTDEMKETIVKAINYAMNNPYEVPETMSTEDPKQDGELNVLMIGNSFCYYFPDELVEMAKAAEQQLRICNVYYSGCKLSQHYNWLKTGEAPYNFFVRSTDGTSTKEEKVSLEYCLAQYNWDIITIQGGSGDVRNAASAEAALESNRVYLDYLLDYYHTLFPKAQLAWHQTWAYQVGQTSHETPIVTTLEDQHVYDEKMRSFALLLCKEYEQYELDRINTGEAWRIVRDGGYDDLCARLGKKWSDDAPENSGDNYHDGDIGGGQFLNACVWYEYLFADLGLDVRDNTFVPTYNGSGLYGLNKNGDGQYKLVGITAETLREAAHAAFTYGTYEIPAS